MRTFIFKFRIADSSYTQEFTGIDLWTAQQAFWAAMKTFGWEPIDVVVDSIQEKVAK